MKKKNPSFTPMSECACTKQLKLNSRCSSQQASPVATTGRRRLACPRSIRLGPMERAVKNPSGLSPTRPHTPSPQPSSRRRRGVSVTASAPNPARTQPPPIGRRAPRVPGEPEPSRTWPPRRGRRRLAFQRSKHSARPLGASSQKSLRPEPNPQPGASRPAAGDGGASAVTAYAPNPIPPERNLRR